MATTVTVGSPHEDRSGDTSDAVQDERDGELVARARAGDREAFDAIVRAHAPRVYRILASFLGADEAEDGAQEVFLNMLVGFSGFRSEASVGTWLYRVATNVALRRVEQRKRRARDLTADLPVSQPEEPDALAAADEERRRLHAALERLPAEQRAVAVLRGIEGLSFEEVARVLRIPVPTAQSRMARAKERLRALLGRM